MTRFDLVIFDCDGVLIDSERLAIRTEAAVLSSLGWSLTESEIVEQFVGRSAGYMQAAIEQKIGRPVNWAVEFDAVYRSVFERELAPVDGVVAALDALTMPTCVASSSSHEMLRFKLELTGLHERFAGRIFGVEDVENAKPEPDMFLYAARSMGIEPDRCAVVEDSLSGVRAGLAAGMRVFGFSGGVTAATALAQEGAVVFAQMDLLPSLLADG